MFLFKTQHTKTHNTDACPATHPPARPTSSSPPEERRRQRVAACAGGAAAAAGAVLLLRLPRRPPACCRFLVLGPRRGPPRRRVFLVPAPHEETHTQKGATGIREQARRRERRGSMHEKTCGQRDRMVHATHSLLLPWGRFPIKPATSLLVIVSFSSSISDTNRTCARCKTDQS